MGPNENWEYATRNTHYALSTHKWDEKNSKVSESSASRSECCAEAGRQAEYSTVRGDAYDERRHREEKGKKKRREEEAKCKLPTSASASGVVREGSMSRLY